MTADREDWTKPGDEYNHATVVLEQVEADYGITSWDNPPHPDSIEWVEIARRLAYAIQGQHQIDNGRDFENNPV